MPIYMDRHDVSETVTAEHVAQLHQQDLKVQDQFGCRGLTYWFDDKRKTAFCLIEAPDKKALEDMHSHAHGDIPHRIIEVEPGIVESFLGRIEDPKKTRDTELNIIDDPAFRTIMIIELKQPGPSQTMSEQLQSSLKSFNRQVTELLATYNSKPVKQNDYYYLVSFKSVSDAIDSAFKIQSVFHDPANANLKNKIILKIGLSAGVPVTEKQLLFEDTIKIADQLCQTIKGEIVITSEVKHLYESENVNVFHEDESVVALTKEDEKFIGLFMDHMASVWNDSNLKVDDFTKRVGHSKSQVYRKMMLLTGKSPNTFIKDYRLNEAVKLLNKNAGNISEIAFETGFSSPSYFSKCFQKKYGHFPSGYLLSKTSPVLEKQDA
ncbi:MAG TPA: nickel-binding protein [Chitinophagaceae bacterium]|jgi:AraC-like DNA-binding protein|nr:nickel-binding protein [Chitinophagaceae bacterium]